MRKFGETDALELLFSTPLAQNLYEDFYSRMCNDKLMSYLELSAHETPDQKILEVGAGTGAMTNMALSMLKQIEDRIGGIAFSEYLYTDISPAFFDKSQERFCAYQDRMAYKPLDLERDMASQGILPASVLRQNGFSGNDLVIRDNQNDAAHWASMIVSTAKDIAPSSSKSRRIILVVDDDDDDDSVRGFQRVFALALKGNLSTSSEHQLEVFSLSQVASAKVSPTNLVVFVAELERPLLSEIFDSKFSHVKTWLQQSNSLLWVTFSDMSSKLQTETPYPYAGLKDGLLRTVRAEFSAKHIVSLTLAGETRDAVSCVNHVLQVIQSAMLKQPPSPETEYIVRDGDILLGRLVENGSLTDILASSVRPAVRTEAWLPGPPLKLDIGTRGQLDTLHFKEDVDYHSDLGPMEVEIEARAWAVNFRDVFKVARLQEGEKVLIHSAAGATGQVAVQIAQMTGAEVFATVGHDKKRQFLMDEYGIPADHIFYSRNTTFAKGIMRMTDGYGVDVVLNSLVGESLRAS
ncbi:hypothetical protein SLS62_002563 [Diatrype stigma]|uniref:Enoyl reductase (ER) domain-containing protein n=1 Tax=Diatrype stigma TaxID=117547 RepID=A0AAN9UXW6_9PEZI